MVSAWNDMCNNFIREIIAKKKVEQVTGNFGRLATNYKRLHYAESLLRKYNRIFKFEPSSEEVNKKNDEKSLAFRVKGNNLHKQGKYGEAFICYNESLCFARSVEHLAIAYSNRSAVLFEMGRFHDCLQNIRLARNAKDLPEYLANRLQKREEQCLERRTELRSWHDLKVAALSYKEHPKVPFIVDRLEIREEGGNSWLYAKEYLEPGMVILKEKPRAMLVPDTQKTHCHFCLKENANLIPCPNCTYAMYCNEDCLHQATEEYHKWECPLMELLTFVDTRLMFSLRMLLKMISTFGDFEEVDKYWKGIGEKRVSWFTLDKKNYGVMEDFRVFHCLVHAKDLIKAVDEGCCLNVAIGVAFLKREILRFSELKSYFQTERQRDLLSDILFHHFITLGVLPTNIITGGGTLSCNTSHTAAYSVIREMKPSSNPNVNFAWAEGHFICATTRPVLKGEVLQMKPESDECNDKKEEISMEDIQKLLFLDALLAAGRSRGIRPNFRFL